MDDFTIGNTLVAQLLQLNAVPLVSGQLPSSLTAAFAYIKRQSWHVQLEFTAFDYRSLSRVDMGIDIKAALVAPYWKKMTPVLCHDGVQLCKPLFEAFFVAA